MRRRTRSNSAALILTGGSCGNAIRLFCVLAERVSRSRMVKISISYTGDLHCVARHGPSGTEIATDAPADNKGRGESFSPTDLVATALASCMATTAAIATADHGVDLSGMTVTIEKHMSKDAPRRIIGLPSKVHIPHGPDFPQRALIEHALLNCPVHKSLPPEIERPTQIFWEG